MPRLAVLLLLSVALAAPAARTGAADPAASATAAPPRRLAVRDLFSGPDLDLRGLTPERARVLGKVLSERVERLPAWFGDEGALHTIVLDGLEVQIGVAVHSGPALTYATLTRPPWRLPGGLGVGVPVARVRAALGPPAREQGNVLVYEGTDEGSEMARFTVEGGTVVRIDLVPYIG